MSAVTSASQAPHWAFQQAPNIKIKNYMGLGAAHVCEAHRHIAWKIPPKITNGQPVERLPRPAPRNPSDPSDQPPTIPPSGQVECDAWEDRLQAHLAPSALGKPRREGLERLDLELQAWRAEGKAKQARGMIFRCKKTDHFLTF